MKLLLIVVAAIFRMTAEAILVRPEERRIALSPWRRWPWQLTPNHLVRGNHYNNSTNSTILAARDAAAAVGVVPPVDVSPAVWKRAYTAQKYATPILHWFDRHKPPNQSLNLYCIWWKALSGNDINSPVFDDYLSYDLLPRGTRWVVLKPYLFPRLHHANVEIRTAFLDRSVTLFSQEYRQAIAAERRDASSTRSGGNVTKIRLISLGAGYDVRSMKLRERDVVDEAYELDLPNVVSAKRKILESRRFQRRRPHTAKESLPTAFPVDLNDVERVKKILLDILQLRSPDGENDDQSWHTIFLFEAVMIYLNESVPRSLLEVCSDVLQTSGQRGSLCFADRLENVPGGEYTSACKAMRDAGWDLVEWLPKPGLARHMGRAKQASLTATTET